MRDPVFRGEQWNRRFDPHVEAINLLVDDLIAERPGSWMPYVAPLYGGTNASVLLLFQDPGKMTALDNGGSGFLSAENDDPSAQCLAECLDMAGVEQSQVLSWNAFPWYLPAQGGVTVAMSKAGTQPLVRLLALLPSVHSVVCHGKVAQRFWRLSVEKEPSLARYRSFDTFHTSGQGIVDGGKQTKKAGVVHVAGTLRAAIVPPTGSTKCG